MKCLFSIVMGGSYCQAHQHRVPPVQVTVGSACRTLCPVEGNAGREKLPAEVGDEALPPRGGWPWALGLKVSPVSQAAEPRPGLSLGVSAGEGQAASWGLPAVVSPKHRPSVLPLAVGGHGAAWLTQTGPGVSPSLLGTRVAGCCRRVLRGSAPVPAALQCQGGCC